MTANRDPLSARRVPAIGQLPGPKFGALVLQESSSALGEHNSAPCQTLHLSLLTTHGNPTPHLLLLLPTHHRLAFANAASSRPSPRRTSSAAVTLSALTHLLLRLCNPQHPPGTSDYSVRMTVLFTWNSFISLAMR